MSGISLIKDPNLVRNRIFVGNVPVCTKEELQSICNPYGRTIGSLVQKNYGFVQFENEEDANRAALALHKSLFKGKIITVRNAGLKPPSKPIVQMTEFNALSKSNNGSIVPFPMNIARAIKNYRDKYPELNDCEIVVMSKTHINYAEQIENRLKALLLRVDLLFPNELGILSKVLANITSRGSLYAVLVTPENVEHNSITVNILHGEPTEHRNMPIDDAVNLISEDFNTKICNDDFMEAKKKINPYIPSINNMLVTANKHPDAILTILYKFTNSEELTEFEYDIFLKYITKKRNELIEEEKRRAPKPVPDPEIILQKKILNIINKPSMIKRKHELVYPNIHSIRNDCRLMELLGDVRVQNALSLLMHSSLVKRVNRLMYKS